MVPDHGRLGVVVPGKLQGRQFEDAQGDRAGPHRHRQPRKAAHLPVVASQLSPVRQPGRQPARDQPQQGQGRTEKAAAPDG